MRSRAISSLSIAGAAALAVPSVAAAADAASVVGGTVPTTAHPLPAAERTLAPILSDAKAPFVRRDVRLARRLAHVKGEHLPAGYAQQLRDWPLDDLKHHAGRLRDAIVRARREARAERRRRREAAAAAAAAAAAVPAGGSTAAAPLQAIAQCESGGNPSAVGGGGQFRGKYQFTYSTWAAVGGSGDPAAAPEAEQDARAAQLYAQAGAGQWPVCGQ